MYKEDYYICLFKVGMRVKPLCTISVSIKDCMCEYIRRLNFSLMYNADTHYAGKKYSKCHFCLFTYM